MSGSTKAVLLGLAGILSGRLLWTVFTGSVPFFPTDELQTAFQQGFAEVSSDWDKWEDAFKNSKKRARRRWGSDWKDSLSLQNQRRAARVSVEYTSDDEVIELYRWRANLLTTAARERRLQGVCIGDMRAFRRGAIPLDMTPLARLAGRALAREQAGNEPWVAPVDVEYDETTLEHFVRYLREKELFVTIGVLRQSTRNPEEMCRGFADLYRQAANHPRDPVGRYTLLDVVRSMDLVAVSE